MHFDVLTGTIDSHFFGPDLVMAETHLGPLETGTSVHRGHGAQVWVGSKPGTDSK